MEPEQSQIGLKPPPLNSDQLNYLIWRYLQEAGYGDAAVKLQRDWNVDAEQLPFAKHIRGQALVNLVQKGLRYHHLSLTIDEHGQSSRTLNPSMLFFGPESAKADTVPARPPLIQPLDSPGQSVPSSVPVPRKRESEMNGALEATPQPARRGRKPAHAQAGADKNGSTARKASSPNPTDSNAMEMETLNGHALPLHSVHSPSAGDLQHDDHLMNGTTMDVRPDVDMDAYSPDANGVESAVDEPEDEAIVPLPTTLSNGDSIGVQVAPAKVVNLGPTTVILSPPQHGPVTSTAWRPGEQPILTVTGELSCGVWQLSRADTPYHDLVTGDGGMVTALAWEPSGQLLAVATYSGHECELHVFDGHDLVLIERLPSSKRLVTTLKWLPSGLRLMGIASYADRTAVQDEMSAVLMWNLSELGVTGLPASISVPELLTDLDVSGHRSSDVSCAAGGSAVYLCSAAPDLVVNQKWTSTSAGSGNWSMVRCSRSERPVIVAASSHAGDIWLPSEDVTRRGAHDMPITGIELRPRMYEAFAPSDIIEFASSSVDGLLKVWTYNVSHKALSELYTLAMEPSVPIMTFSFSPDGFCLAGAGFDQVRIWNAEHGYNVMASWQGMGPEWQGALIKDEIARHATSDADQGLSWDSDSKKLSFSLASQVAVVNFQR